MISEKENMLRMLNGKKNEFVPAVINLIDLVVPSVQVDYPENYSTGVDGFGCKWIVPDNEPILPDASAEHILEDISEWRDVVKWPDLAAVDWESHAKKDLKNINSEKILMVQLTTGPFERLHTLMSFEDALIATITEPEECKAFFTKFCDFRIEQFQYIKKYYDPDMIQFHDDWGSQRDLFFSPEFWDYALKDNIKRVIDAAHELGIYFNMHTCGKVDKIIGNLVALGPDMIDSMMVCNDLDHWMEAYGDRVIFMGGLDAQGVIDRSDVTLSAIKTEVKNRVQRYGSKGYYIPMAYSTSENLGPALLIAAWYGYRINNKFIGTIRFLKLLPKLKAMRQQTKGGLKEITVV